MTERLTEQEHPANMNNISALQEVLVQGNIFLRPLRADDAAEILAILDDDPEIRDRVLVASKMHTAEDVAAQVEVYQKDPHTIRYAITEGDTAIGLVSFWRDIDTPLDTPDSPNDYGFGYFLSPKKRGAGIVTNAVQRLMDTAVNCLYIENFIAFCEKDNPESIAVLTKLGFHLTNIKLTEQNKGWVEYKYIKEVGH